MAPMAPPKYVPEQNYNEFETGNVFCNSGGSATNLCIVRRQFQMSEWSQNGTYCAINAWTDTSYMPAFPPR